MMGEHMGEMNPEEGHQEGHVEMHEHIGALAAPPPVSPRTASARAVPLVLPGLRSAEVRSRRSPAPPPALCRPGADGPHS